MRVGSGGKPMKIRFAMLAMCLFFGSVSTPSEAFYTARGAGVFSCGTWIQRGQTDLKYSYENWLIGFVNGASFMISGLDLWKNTDIAAALAWVDNYCQSNPLQDIGIAAGQLVQELVNKEKRGF
jgi:hypothetical protein